MKTFNFSPLFIIGALVATISGCAATASTHSDVPKAPSTMGAADNMGKGVCACCDMQQGSMSKDGKQGNMGMTQDKAAAPQGTMCMPAKDGTGKSGCGCCDKGKKEMSPDMHKKHMEMMQQHHPEMQNKKIAPAPTTK